ncbi:hypothetical protein [Halalkalibacterium ligniniphilum]|uniref:hypothetical protein n=1 Tax=Halalkalibacterium ligniniphilum TaxID=1134413 RepID=UPI00034C355F|nr:hypothetical protein [Halalkalibacterium ligniniphilum]
MKHVEQDLAAIRKAIEKARDMRYRAEAKLEELENQHKRLLEDLEELGVKPEELEGEIARLEQEIDQGLKETWNLIPKELMKDE